MSKTRLPAAWLPGMKTLLVAAMVMVAAHPLEAGPNPSRFGDTFPIMGWVGPPAHERTLERYQEMAEAGLTVSFRHPLDKLDLAEQAGLLAIVSDRRIHKALSTDDPVEIKRLLDPVVAACRKRPSVVGFALKDEPSADLFPSLGRVSSFLRQALPGSFPYINLFPSYAAAEQLGTDTYDAHVAQFIKVVKPAVVSYDHYPPVKRSWRDNYYEDLELIRRQTLAAGLPFWAFCLTTPHGNYRDPTEAEIRLQVYSDLVYGAKGICYFCYWTPGPSETWDWDSAIILRDGTRTEHFDHVRRVNARVKKMGHILLKCESTNVFHTLDLPAGTRQLPEDSPIRCLGHVPLVYGFFRHENGSEYVMILNRDYAHNVRSRLRVQGIARLEEVAPRDWIWSTDGVPGADGTLPFRLYAGDARLFRIVRR